MEEDLLDVAAAEDAEDVGEDLVIGFVVASVGEGFLFAAEDAGFVSASVREGFVFVPE